MPHDKKKSELAIARKGKVGKISIDGVIGWDYFGMSYSGFKQALADLGKVDIIEVEINSPGGVVTEGVAMINALKEHGATVHTYNVGQAASMGSAVLLAGDRIFIPDNAMTFIHKPLNITMGNADDMRKMATELDKFENALVSVYSANFKGDTQGIHDLMATETWFSADEMADKFNNVTVIASGEQQAAAHSDPFEIFGEVGLKESLADKAVNALRNRVQGKVADNKEVDMTPEERTDLVADITSAVVEAMKPKEPVAPVVDVVEKEEVVIAFEGDMTKPEDVQAHADKVALAELTASADMSTTAGVVAYQAALKKHLEGDKGTEQPASNAQADTVVAKASDNKFTADEHTSAIDRMSPKA
jgi:ATP-dependent Clp protease protease subunit